MTTFYHDQPPRRPNINPGIVSIENEDSLNYYIDAFNTSFSHLGITVERQDMKSECDATLTKLSKKDNHNNNYQLLKYNRLIEWVSK
jgi:hypothetical protein